jgi:large subunit ribosomal protein L15
MAVKGRKKNTRQRGSKTHGWGSMKKHRGKGNKGGSGMAGTGKRGDAKKPVIWKNKKYFGKHGFKSNAAKKVKAINLDAVERMLEKLVSAGKAKKEGDSTAIDLSAIGFGKLLGKGIVKSKMNISVDAASGKAISKVEEKGGKVNTKKEQAEETAEETK